jgi:hypothetical protein
MRNVNKEIYGHKPEYVKKLNRYITHRTGKTPHLYMDRQQQQQQPRQTLRENQPLQRRAKTRLATGKENYKH